MEHRVQYVLKDKTVHVHL